MKNEGLRVQEVEPCLLCGSKGKWLYKNQQDRLFGAVGIWSLMYCPECTLVWLNPRPLSEDFEKIYEAYFTHGINEHFSTSDRLRKLIRDSILAIHMNYPELARSLSQKMLGRILRLIWPIKEMAELSVAFCNGKTRGKLLDIGCGHGKFLAKMQELGWEVIGVEPDKEAVKMAREKFGLNIHQGTLEQAGFFSDSFDVITMSHVIEHIPDPIRILKECQRILKPNGYLVILTPNNNCLGAYVFKEAWRGWEIPRHLFIFSTRSLQNLVEKTGLYLIQLKTTARSTRLMWIASRLIQQKGVLYGGLPTEQGILLKLEGLFFQAIEYGLARFKDIGEEILLVAQKR